MPALKLTTITGFEIEVIKHDGDYTLLKLESNKITPYAVVEGLHYQDETGIDKAVEWNYGHYFNSLKDAEDKFYSRVNLTKENTTTENSDDSVVCLVCGKTNDKYIRKGETIRFKTNYCSNCGTKFNQNALQL